MRTHPVLLLVFAIALSPATAFSATTTPPTQMSTQEQAALVIRCWNERALPRGLTESQWRVVSGVIQDLRGGRVETAKSSWKRLFADHVAADHQRLMHYALHEAYREQLGQMFPYADKVRFSTEATESVRVQLDRAKALRAKTDSKARVSVPVNQLRPYAPNGNPVVKTAPRSMLGSELSPYIAGLEKQEKDLESRRNLAQLEFQNADQKRNQFLNLLISVMKTMHEMMAISRNIRP